MMTRHRKILFNVGGTYFTTCRSTLVRSAPRQSPLRRILSSSTNVVFERDERGAFWIDRDPEYFRVILNYMRHGHLVMTRDVCDEGLLLEADYYHLPEVIQLVKQRQQQRALGGLAPAPTSPFGFDGVLGGAPATLMPPAAGGQHKRNGTRGADSWHSSANFGTGAGNTVGGASIANWPLF